MKTKERELLARIVLGQREDSCRIKMFPALDCPGRPWLCDYGCLTLGLKLAKRLAMTMVWLILRDDDEVWLFDFRQVLDGWGNVVFGDGEFGMCDHRVACYPWIDQDRIGGLGEDRLMVCGRRVGGKGQEEG